MDFDNVFIRVRGRACVAASVNPPFVTAYWPVLENAIHELGLSGLTDGLLSDARDQSLFLTEISRQSAEAARFKPERVGWAEPPEAIRCREDFRDRYFHVTLNGQCSRVVTLSVLEVLMGRLKAPAHIDVSLKGWDPLCDWNSGREGLDDILQCLGINGYDCALKCFSQFKNIPPKFSDYIYERPQIQMVWLAEGVENCTTLAEFQTYRQIMEPLQKLRELVGTGLWPCLLVPVSLHNVAILPEIVLALCEDTRGGVIRLVTTDSLSDSMQTPLPLINEYVAALVSIYNDSRIPLRHVSPQSWVAARMEADVPLVSSPEAAGACLTVFPNGDLFAGECSRPLPDWRLGNILEGVGALKWERIDSMAELWLGRGKAPRCYECVWRYRCGGLDPSLYVGSDTMDVAPTMDSEARVAFYCHPRRALFEEALWGVVAKSIGGHSIEGKEIVELDEQRVRFVSCNPRDQSLAT